MGWRDIIPGSELRVTLIGPAWRVENEGITLGNSEPGVNLLLSKFVLKTADIKILALPLKVGTLAQDVITGERGTVMGFDGASVWLRMDAGGHKTLNRNNLIPVNPG